MASFPPVLSIVTKPNPLLRPVSRSKATKASDTWPNLLNRSSRSSLCVDQDRLPQYSLMDAPPAEGAASSASAALNDTASGRCTPDMDGKSRVAAVVRTALLDAWPASCEAVLVGGGAKGGKKPKVRASKVRDARVAPPPHITNQMPELDEEKLRHWGALPPEEGKLSPHQEEREQAAREALQFERKPKRTRRAEVVIPSWMETLLPNDKKLWWLANGWLVDDIVHTQRPGQVQAQPSPPRSWLRAWPCLLAHVLFMAHVVALGAVLGAWGPTASSITQLAAAIAIKGAWIQYVITLRPYSSITALVVEPVLGSVELSLLAFALVNNEGTDSVSDPALVAIALLLAAVGIVIILEIGRIIILSLALHKAARERCAEAEERERHHEQQQQQEQQHKQ
eukprot:CAMPEP_0202391940 /NCGR_PEP_ID=MMETSP1127-20130417/92105_1 /ASSEMBLY_ACC=CAM_ASM_000462 /TAXON_ID=3047 /ORGANISM="Dunaliella tertiolecta, Strain CCMP1320" /LENGTH=395 /DNA_ID=CAMNT_0048994409 /DNA_START=762 /DNA_END=1950 /DNA_ORIENTATION=+